MGAVYAHEAVESLCQTLGPQTVVQASYWSFDMLDPLDTEQPSLRLAAGADLVIVAAFAEEPLPANVRSWVMTAMRESDRAAPYIAAFHPDASLRSELESPMCEFLNAVAMLWHTDFLCNESFDHRLGDGLATELLQRQRMKPRKEPCAYPRTALASGFCWGVPA